MLIFTLKKILRNKWMVLCLLIGSIAFVAVLSAIPTYTNGVFRHILVRDLEEQQIREDRYPGSYYLTFVVWSADEEERIERHETARQLDNRISNQYIPDIGLPVLASRRQYNLSRLHFYSRTADRTRSVSVRALENFENHVELVTGRFPQSNPTSDILEFVLFMPDYQNSDIPLNVPFNLYTRSTSDDDYLYRQAMCVGVFRINDGDPYWYANTGLNTLTFITDFDYVTERYVEPESEMLLSFSVFYSLDYSTMRTEYVRPILDAIAAQRAQIGRFDSITFYMERTLNTYLERIEYLGFMLQVLNIPVILMLIFYIYMVSRFMIYNERNEIAVLKSRGARNSQILAVYVLESALIAGTALLIGPPLGLLICRMLGLSNGFMELVARRGLSFELSAYTYLYAAAAAGGFIIVMLLPIPGALKDTIVKSKQKKSRRQNAPVWQKMYLDILLTAASLYSIRLYTTSAYIQTLTDAGGVDAPIDPLLLIASALFVLGAGLFFLRIFPYLISGLYHIGKRIWSPALYSTLLSMVRTKENTQFLALFLIFSIGLGLFYATAARTINKFLEDRVRYEIGADIVLSENWPTQTINYRMSLSEDGSEVVLEQIITTDPFEFIDTTAPDVITQTQFREPPFERVMSLSGVEDATRVFTRNNARVSLRGTSFSAELMGIVPHEFGRVAWFRNGLLPHHINAYLNLMTVDPSAVFLSSSMQEHGFNIGDHVRIGWAEQSRSLDGTVYGFLDFWPSINPILSEGRGYTDFVVVNLDSLNRQMRMEPHSVWIRTDEYTSSADLYESINESDIRLATLHDTNQQIITTKNDPLLQGMNGTLTLGFIVTLCITFIGFLIYWILSIRSRLLQFGIFRAMGLSKMKIVSMLLWEQLFVSGSAILAGLGIGLLASRLFVPMLQLIYAPSEQTPPFMITISPSDYAAIFIAIGSMLITGLVVLSVMIRKLKVDQVLKLGED